MKFKYSVFGGIMGVIIGDALGIPVQFMTREEVKAKHIKGMTGYGTFNLPPGSWSDDSSLTLCLIDLLINGYDLNDISKKFIDWYDNGLWTPFDESYDIGRATRDAIKNLKKGIEPQNAGPNDEYSNGDGSLMYILPVAFYVRKMDFKKQMNITHDISSITHGHPRSKIACGYYVQFILQILKGANKNNALTNTNEIILDYYDFEPYKTELKHYKRILNGEIGEISEDEINSSGYVVDALEASLWSFLNSESFDETILTAVDLGGDTDTIGAIAGGLAGVFYGFNAINKEWINTIIKKDEILDLMEKFYGIIK